MATLGAVVDTSDATGIRRPEREAGAAHHGGAAVVLCPAALAAAPAVVNKYFVAVQNTIIARDLRAVHAQLLLMLRLRYGRDVRVAQLTVLVVVLLRGRLWRRADRGA